MNDPLILAKETGTNSLEGRVKAHLNAATAIEDIGNLGSLNFPDDPCGFLDPDHPLPPPLRTVKLRHRERKKRKEK